MHQVIGTGEINASGSVANCRCEAGDAPGDRHHFVTANAHDYRL